LQERKVYVAEETGNVYLASDDELTDQELTREYCFPVVCQRVQQYFKTDDELVKFLRANKIRPRKQPIPAHAPTFELYPA